MLTGARVNEIVKATATELQPEGIVKAEHKTSRYMGDKTVHLPRRAREIIAALPPCPSGRLFGIIRLRAVWTRICAEADCAGLTLRDARRTFASVARSLGVPVEHVGDLFGHTDVDTTNTFYSFTRDDVKQQVVERVAEEILTRAGGAPAPRRRFKVRRIRWHRGRSSPEPTPHPVSGAGRS